MQILNSRNFGGGGNLGRFRFFEYLSNPLVSGQAARSGFTLAEVLITLGIIGVVAAITMPTIVANIQDKQNIARWKKAYSVISQAYVQTVNEGYEPCSKSHYGCPDTAVLKANQVPLYYWYDKAEGITAEFKTQFISKFNGAIICDNSNNCKTNSYVHPSKIRPKTLSGGLIGSYNFGSTRIKLSTGELVMFGGSHGGPWLSVDVNGPENGPNIIGKDIFVMKLYDTAVKPMGAEGTYNPDTNDGECLCGKQYGVQGETYYFGGASGAGLVASGACCSAVYLSK